MENSDSKNDKEKNGIKYEEIQIGKTIHGQEIFIVYSCGKNYVIYSTKDDPFGIKIDSDLGDNQKSVDEAIFEVQRSKLDLESKTSGEVLPPGYNFSIAQIYKYCIFNKPDEAKKYIKDLETTVIKYQKKIKKIKETYLFGGICFVILNIIICVVMYYTEPQLNYGPLFTYFKIATFGSLGGFISVVIKTSQMKFSIESNNWINVLTLGSRILIAMFSSIAIYVLIKANVILGVLNYVSEDGKNYLFYIMAFLSGFSETYIPDIMSKIEKKTVGEKK